MFILEYCDNPNKSVLHAGKMTASTGGEIIVDNIGKEEAMYPIIDNVKTGERIQKELKEISTNCNNRLFAYYIKFNELVA